jgi:anaerobic selenocysteine-containing dehydrogenase
MSSSSPSQLRTACNRDCPDACGIIATVEDGRVTRIQGDPDHPVTKGFLCHRTSRFLDRQYDPSRITTPLIRRDGTLQVATWDEALERIADKMLEIRAESGPAAILNYRCGGSMGMMKQLTDHFFNEFGPVTIKSGDICAGAGDAAQKADFGVADSNDLFDLFNSKTIVIWGKNLFVSSVHLLPVVREARKRGTRIVLIDPVSHKTKSICDQYIQPRPGGDSAIAFGVVRWLIDHDQIDPTAAEYCDHLDEFTGIAAARSVHEWAEEAGISVEELDQLAAAYAESPAAILVGWGMQRRTSGSGIVRAIDGLAAVSGNLGVAGGGVSFYFKRRGAFEQSFLENAQPAPRSIPEPLLGPGILEASDPPIRMVWVSSANPVAMLPESKVVKEALETRELTVVVDAFLTDTAQCADIVLPTTTMLEEDDLLGAYGHHWLAEMSAVIAPPPEVKTDYEIIQRLAQRVELGEQFSESVETWQRRFLSGVSELGASLEDLRKGAVRNPLAKPVLFATREFETPTGRVNLVQNGPAPVASVPPDFPLLLMAFSTEKAQSSQWDPKTQQGPADAVLHPDSAAEFRDGDIATVESRVGSLQVRLRFDDNQRKDVLLMEKGGWLSAGRCANVLIKAELTDAGECAVYYDTPVRIRNGVVDS